MLMNAFTPDRYPFVDVTNGQEIAGKVRHTSIENALAHEVDEFCGYLLNFDRIEKSGAVTWRFLDPHLRYWLGKLVDNLGIEPRIPERAEEAIRLREQLQKYIREYYPDVD